jgi:4'-phosphopantetheinyl transferase
MDEPLTFNLSHTRGLVACVVAYGEDVGVDVEPIAAAPDLLDLARANFSAEEVAELERCVPADRPARFTGMWTLKEAYLKATGAGIATRLGECTVTLTGALPLLRVKADGSERMDDWHVLLMDLPGYRLAAAVRAPGERVQFVVDAPPRW